MTKLKSATVARADLGFSRPARSPGQLGPRQGGLKGQVNPRSTGSLRDQVEDLISAATRGKNGTTPSVDPIDVVVEHVVRATVRAWLTQGKWGHEGCTAQHLSEVEHLVQLPGRVRVLGHEGDAVLVPRPDARVARLARPHVLDKDGLLPFDDAGLHILACAT